MNDEAVNRTAPATPGLLKTLSLVLRFEPLAHAQQKEDLAGGVTSEGWRTRGWSCSGSQTGWWECQVWRGWWSGGGGGRF